MIRGQTAQGHHNASGIAVVAALLPMAWYRLGAGITVATGVSQWNDQSGNGNHLTQATAGLQPLKQADGSILFDGSDDFLAAANSLAQPFTVYLRMKTVVWTNNNVILGMNSGVSCSFRMGAITPGLQLAAGSTLQEAGNLAVGSYGAVVCVYNGNNSIIGVNGTEASGAGGANGTNGLQLGSNSAGGANSNIQVKELILYASAHDATTRARVTQYLQSL